MMITDHVDDLKQRSDHQSCLMDAIRTGDLAQVKRCCQGLSNLDFFDEQGRSPLHYAAQHGHVEVIAFLIMHWHVAVDQVDRFGMSALHVASAHGHLPAVEKLVDLGATLDHCSHEGVLPLHCASVFGHKDVVEFFVDQCGMGVDVSEGESGTPIQLAVQFGWLELVRYLYDKQADLSIKNSDGHSLLSVAVQEGRFDVVEYLVSKGFALNVQHGGATGSHSDNDADGESLAHIAVDFDLCRQDYQTLSKDGFMATYALPEPQNKVMDVTDTIKTITYLHDRGVRFDVEDEYGYRPLHLVSGRNCVDLIDCLVNHCQVSADVMSGSGLTALHIAAKNGCLDSVQYLVERCDLHPQTLDQSLGRNALDIAVRSGHVSLAYYLSVLSPELASPPAVDRQSSEYHAGHDFVGCDQALCQRLSDCQKIINNADVYRLLSRVEQADNLTREDVMVHRRAIKKICKMILGLRSSPDISCADFSVVTIHDHHRNLHFLDHVFLLEPKIVSERYAVQARAFLRAQLDSMDRAFGALLGVHGDGMHAIMSTVMSYLPATLSSLHTVTSGSAMIMNDWNHDVTQRSNEVKSVLSGLIDQIDSGSFQPKAVADDDPTESCDGESGDGFMQVENAANIP